MEAKKLDNSQSITIDKEEQISPALPDYSGAELFIWLFIAVGYSAPLLYDLIFFGLTVPHEEVARENFRTFSTSLFIAFFVISFRLIFNAYPVESIALSLRRNDQNKTPKLTHSPPTNPPAEQRSGIQQSKIPNDSPIEYLSTLAKNSAELANAIFLRSGVFLLIGGCIALFGIFFFYYNTHGLELSTKTNATTITLSLAKQFGILLSIEFVAFFFLRQYRSAMDDFRYYESTQRSREETAAIVQLLRANNEEVDIYQLAEKCGIRSNIDQTQSSKATELLESKKLNKEESEIFIKLLDILGKKI